MFKSKKATQKVMAVICAIGLIVGESNVTVSKAAQKPVSLLKTNLSLKLGKSKTVKIKKAAGIKIKKKTFTSSKKKVAAITKNGKITAKKTGKTIIKAKVKYQKNKKIKTTTLKCTVKVIGNNSNTATANTNENPVAAPYINPAISPSQSPADSGAVTATPKATSSQKPQQTQTSAPADSQQPQPTQRPTPTNTSEPTQSPDASFDITLPREAGLYDADGTMIKTWNELTEDGFLKIEDNHLVSNDYIDAATGYEMLRNTSDMVGNLIIPKTITAIYYYSFGYNCGLTGIQIPDSITEIKGAFDCGQLERLAVAPGNTVYDSRNHCNAIIDTETNTLIAGCKNTVIPDTVTSIGGYAFYGCNGLISIEIPNGVTNIESASFVECDDLKRIEIPDSVICIGDIDDTSTSYRNSSILKDCSSLENIVVATGNTRYDSRMNCNAIIDTETNALITGCKNTVIPNNVTRIDAGAFTYCTNLTNIVIPDSVTSIEHEAFYGCTNLGDIVIPSSVTSIGNGAFIECKSLTSIVIPDSVTTIGFGGIESLRAFDNDYLESIVVASGNTKYDSRENCNAIIDTKTNTLLFGCKNTVIPNSVTTIGSDSFSSCQDLTSLTIPGSVTSVERAAFQDCSKLTGLKMSDGLTEIGDCAFERCNITSIEIPGSVVSIGWKAFCRNNLTSIEIPDSVKCIGDEVFRGNNLEHISVAAENTEYDSRENCNAVIATRENRLLIGCKDTIIPNTVTSIGYSAFMDCTNLTNITIPNNIIHINISAFYGCTNLTNVTIPHDVSSIGRGAFYAVPLVIYDGDLPVEDWGANQVQRSDGTIIYADKDL